MQYKMHYKTEISKLLINSGEMQIRVNFYGFIFHKISLEEFRTVEDHFHFVNSAII